MTESQSPSRDHNRSRFVRWPAAIRLCLTVSHCPSWWCCSRFSPHTRRSVAHWIATKLSSAPLFCDHCWFFCKTGASGSCSRVGWVQDHAPDHGTPSCTADHSVEEWVWISNVMFPFPTLKTGFGYLGWNHRPAWCFQFVPHRNIFRLSGLSEVHSWMHANACLCFLLFFFEVFAL